MDKTLISLRVGFVVLATAGCFAFWFFAGDVPLIPVLIAGLGLAALAILVDISVKGFSVRGLTAISFGLAIGLLISFLISASPLFEPLDASEELAQTRFLIRLILFVLTMYLCMVIALRGKDDFNLVIPYVRFTAEKIESPLAIVDTSALIDGRLAALCETRWFSHSLIIPRFVLNELQSVADSSNPSRRERGRRGIETLNRLRKLRGLDLRINESQVPHADLVDSKLIFLAESMRAKLITTDYNLAKLAEFHGIQWLDITSLVRAINQEVSIGSTVAVKLVKAGKDRGQAVGYLPDGSMIVLDNCADKIGSEITATVESVVPSSAGKLMFASLVTDGSDTTDSTDAETEPANT